MTLGWKTRPLFEVAELRGRIGWKGLTAKEYVPEGPYFLSVHSLNYGACVDFRDAFHISQQRYDESPEIMLRLDDVLICKDGAGIGKVGIVGTLPGQTTINSSLLLIRAKPNVLPKYLYHILQSPYFQEIVKSRLEGATTPHLYQRDISTFPVHLPPLEEQQRLVSILDEAFEGIDAAVANARRNAESALQLSSDAINAEFKRAETVAGTVPLWQLCSFENGDRGENYPNKSARVLDGIPFINAGHLSGRSVNMMGMDYIAPERFSLLRSGKPKDGDILFCLRGSLGKFGIVHGIGDCAIASSLVIVRPKATVLPEYIAAYFASGICAEMIETYRSGTAQPNLGAKQLSAFRIPALDPNRQAELVKRTDAFSRECRALADLNEKKIAALAELKQALLVRAFSGDLTREPLAA